ncbi:MAG: hypothetical protein QF578_03590 [Alphaproteobacteria bacterium]|jgi:hypothetical protein|nr:hypothetical protein [Alphaproteobacteria bacterium]MDP6815924.1 hypothetical protein [Alphaproteobacteria bacterium]
MQGYLFKHALIQDAVYNSLLEERREALHGRVADAIEQRNTGRLGEIAETLAHHYGHTSRAEKAVHYMAQAGEKRLKVYSLDEAEVRLRQVVELIEKVPGCADDAFLVDVLLNLARIQYFRADMYGLIELLEPHLAKAEALGDPRRLGRYLFEIGYAHVFSGNSGVGVSMLMRVKEIGEEHDDELTIGYASLGLMWDRAFWGDMNETWRGEVDQLSAEAERIGRKFNDNWLAAKAIVCMSTSNTLGGRPNAARKHALRLIEFGREMNDPRPRSMAMWALALLDLTHFAFADAVESGREGARLALSIVDRSAAEGGMAAGQIMLGQTNDGRPLLSGLDDLFLKRGFVLAPSAISPYLGVAMVMDGEMAAGIQWIEDCMEKCQSWGSNTGVPSGHLFLGEIYTRMALDQDRPSLGVMLRNLPFLIRTLPRVTSLAYRHLETALNGFRQADVPSFAAWALYDLALLDQKKGRSAEAAAKFTEAREFAKSVEAMALLELIDAAVKPA